MNGWGNCVLKTGMTRRFLQFLVFGGLVLGLSTSLFAQVNQGRILGTVRDQSGGSIAGATVTVTDVLKNVGRTLTTDDAGEYAAPNLDPSTYSVRVEFKGFKTFDRQGLVIAVGQEAKIDITLQPGEQTQTVTVNEDAPLVETTSATLTGNINTQTIAELPLNGRNYINLLSLRPGYINSPGGGAGNQAGMGLRQGDTMFIVDGLTSIDWNQGSQVINGYSVAGDASTLLPIDAIQDFNIQQNPKAEFGWEPGAQVNLGLKSGTNGLHGTAYAFGRDGSWDADNFFQPKNQAVPPVQFYQYGATAGGPIKKDKIFWFTGFEAQKLSLGITTPIAAPVDVLLPGGNTKSNVTNSIVNACEALGPSKITALSAQLAGLNPTTCVVSPASASVENVFVNNQGPSTAVVPGGLASLTDSNSSYNGLAKVDYHANDRNNLTGMFFIGQTAGTWDDNPSAEVSQWWTTYTPIRVRVGSGGWTFVPNSNFVNELNVGYTYSYRPYLSTDANVNPASPWGLSSAGLPTGYGINTGVVNPEYFGFPRISITGFTLMGGNWPKIIGPDANTEFVDHLSYLHGKHALKFGGEVTFVQGDGGATTNAKGRFNFKKATVNSVALTPLESYLEGNVATGSAIFVGNPVRDMHNEMYALFFQDDYRVTQRLTVNYGLRWELATVIQEANNQLGNFDPNSPTGFVQVGDGLSSPYNGDHHDFSPRLGFAWDITGKQKTVVRGGVSLLYEFVPYSAFLQLGGNSVGIGKVPTGADICVYGNCVAGSGTIAAASIVPPTSPTSGLSLAWQNEGPNSPIFSAAVACGDGNLVKTGPADLVGSTPGPCSTGAIERNLQTPYVETWNLDIQHSFTQNLSLDVAYIGNHGVKLYGTQDLNAPPLGAGWGNPAVAGTPAYNCVNSANTGYNKCSVNTSLEVGPYSAKFPYISYIDYLSNLYRSHYNAAQVTLTQRTSHGVSFTATYTYSHALDDVSQNFGSTIPLNNAAPNESMYGNSDYDIRNRFTFEANYLIPGKKTPGQILEGWQLTSIVTLQSATPWNVQDLSQDISGTGEVNNPNPWGEDWDLVGKAKNFIAVPGLVGFPYVPGGGSNAAPTANTACNSAAAALGPLALASLSNLGCYASGSSVLIPPAYGTYGNLGRGTFRDTPFKTWDMSIQKNTKIRERLNVQFRAEFFNILNHPLFGDIGSRHLAQNDPSTGGFPFGAASETPDQSAGNPVLGSGSNRDVQLGLKLIF